MDLSIITVGFKSKAFLVDLVPTILAARGHLAIEVFVIDNGHLDDAIDVLRAQYGDEYQGVRFHYIQNEDNL